MIMTTLMHEVRLISQYNHFVEDSLSWDEKKKKTFCSSPSTFFEYIDNALASLLSLPKTNNPESNPLDQLSPLPF